jgi:hypothetical protein
MVQALDHTRPALARVEEGTLVLEWLEEDDPVVLRVVSDADDVEQAARSCLEVGARALVAGHAALDEVLVGRSFDRLVERLDGSVDREVGRITEAATQLVGEDDGALTKMFVDLKAQLEERLGALFDPDSKTSAMALLEEVFSDSSTKVLHTLRGALDPDDDATPLGRWRAELSKAIHEQNETVLREIRDLATAMAVREARVDLWERSTQKGVAFEELVGMAFTEVGTIHGDIVEPVGRERGCDGSLVGDIVVTLSPDDCPTGRAAFVLEAKTRKLTLRKTLDELDVAMANRESTAGIAVFSDRALAPTPSLFSAYGDKAVLVLDAELPDPQAVELAYAWARWIVRRAGSEDAPEADARKVREAIDAAVHGLDRAMGVRRCFNTIRRSAGQGSDELAELVAEVRAAVEEIRSLLAPE